MPQQLLKPQKRKKKEAKLEFDPAKAFGTENIKDEDLDLDLESGRFVAQKGQGGSRRTD